MNQLGQLVKVVEDAVREAELNPDPRSADWHVKHKTAEALTHLLAQIISLTSDLEKIETLFVGQTAALNDLRMKRRLEDIEFEELGASRTAGDRLEG